MTRSTSATSVDFFDSLRKQEAQAAAFGARHLVAVPDTDSMLYWLGEAAKEARLAKGRRQVHVAASTRKGVDQSTVARFEKHKAWPRNPDQTIRAYADDLDLDALELWEQAIRMWREDREATAEMRKVVRDLEASADAPSGQQRRRS